MTLDAKDDPRASETSCPMGVYLFVGHLTTKQPHGVMHGGGLRYTESAPTSGGLETGSVSLSLQEGLRLKSACKQADQGSARTLDTGAG